MKVTIPQLKAARKQLIRDYNICSQLYGHNDTAAIKLETQIKQITKALGS